MAYNPFNIFRRNQKAIFAVITVIIMFVFVLSSGLGGGADFFDWLPRWLRSTSKNGDVVCSMDGDKIYQSDLTKLNFKRVMANRFMLDAARETWVALYQFEEQQLQLISDPYTQQVLRKGPEAVRQMQQFGPAAAQIPQLRQMAEMAKTYSEIATSPTAKPAEKEIIRARQLKDLLQFFVSRAEMDKGELYFYNAPNKTENDRIDFMLWLKKANQLEISFSTDDIYRLIRKEFYEYFPKDAEIRIHKTLQKSLANFDFDECIAAIGDEFRVRAAQAAVLGNSIYMRPDKYFGGSTIFNPPFEVFEFYRDRCSPTDYAAFPVPVEGFIDRVTQNPSDKELAALYDQYKDAEPNPGRETPGFKIPRMVKLEWVSASGSEPYYQKLAEESLKAGELQARLGSLMTVPLPGMSPAWVGPAIGPQLPKDLMLDLDSVRGEYERLVVGNYEATVKFDWLNPSFVTRFLDTSALKPQTLAATLGGFAGGTLTLSGSLSGLGTFESTLRAMELRDRILAGTPPVLGAVPGPGMFGTLMGGYAAMESLIPKPLPIDVIKPELMKNLAEKTAKQLVLNDMKTFMAKVEELSEKGNAKDKGPVIKYINEFIAARGWQHGASEKLRSEYTLEDDPGLVPLRDSLTKDPTNPHGNAVVQFGRRFFWAGADMPGFDSSKTPVTGTYKPEFYPKDPNKNESPSAKPEPRFLVWRTEESRGKPAPDFQTAKEQVRAAWKRIKARDLAKEAAQALANQERSMPGDIPLLIDQNMRELANSVRNGIADPKFKERVKVFDIRNVAPLTDARGQYMNYNLGRTTDIPYPTPAMQETLLNERTKPPKTSFVLVDEPKDTYYVVVLKNRQVKSEYEFSSLYSESSRLPPTPARQSLMRVFNTDAAQKAMRSVMGLLKQEFKFEASEDQRKKLNEGDKKGTSPEMPDIPEPF